MVCLCLFQIEFLFTIDCLSMKDIGISNLPNLHHKFHLEKGIQFNIVVIGSHGLGKTTFVNNFFGQEVLSSELKTEVIQDACSIEVNEFEVNEENYKIKMDIIEIDGIGDNIDNSKCYKPVIELFIERFNEYQEQSEKYIKQSINDNRIHLCLYFLEPICYVKDSDLIAFQTISDYCNVIPIVSKADLLTTDEIEVLRDLIQTKYKEDPFFISCTTDCNLKKEYNWGILDISNFDMFKLREYILEKQTIYLIDETEYLYDQYRISQLANETPEGQEFLKKLAHKQQTLDQIKERIKKKQEML